MKHLFFFACAAMVMASCNSGTSPETTPEAAPTTKFYGAEFDLSNAMEVAALPAKMEAVDSMEVVVSGKIVETCSKAGCWMTVDLGQGEPMWVYTDHEFFVPTEGCAGLPVVIKGIARKEVQSVDDQKHYAEDANKTAEDIAMITEPRSVFSIDAVGIMIDGYKGTAEMEAHDHDHEGHDHAEGEEHDHEH